MEPPHRNISKTEPRSVEKSNLRTLNSLLLDLYVETRFKFWFVRILEDFSRYLSSCLRFCFKNLKLLNEISAWVSNMFDRKWLRRGCGLEVAPTFRSEMRAHINTGDPVLSLYHSRSSSLFAHSRDFVLQYFKLSNNGRRCSSCPGKPSNVMSMNLIYSI